MTMTFEELREDVKHSFENRWNSSLDDLEDCNENLILALRGYPEGEEYFKDLIVVYLKTYQQENTPFPDCYMNLVEAIYHENWGYAGMAEWFSEKYKESSSAKIIGTNIFFLINGVETLMPQKISNIRRAQLVKKLLSIKPEERSDKDFHEVLLLSDIRISIYNESMSKPGQDSIVFRRYTVPEYTLEEQADRGTIDPEMIPLLECMVKLGYNLAITGPVRSAKSTFLATLLRYKDPRLEGVFIETSPEVAVHRIMPNAPIIQIIADGEKLKHIIKPLMRSDADFLIMAEAREGVSLYVSVTIANKGTRHSMMTFHNSDPLDFVEDVSSEIVISLGGTLDYVSKKVAKSVDHILHFKQLDDKSQKRLVSIQELTFVRKTKQIIQTEICKYDEKTNKWGFRYCISEDKERAGKAENEKVFNMFQENLKFLAEKKPLDPHDDGRHVITV